MNATHCFGWKNARRQTRSRRWIPAPSCGSISLLIGVLGWAGGSPRVAGQTAGELAVPDVFGGGARRDGELPPSSFSPVPAGLRGVDGMPYVAPDVAPRSNYNMRIGNAGMTFYTTVNFTYTDNALMSAQGRNDDFIINPMVGSSIKWDLRPNQSLRFDVGVGYRKSINFPEFDALIIMPSSMIDYRFSIGNVLFTVFNTTSTPAMPRPELVGQGGDPTSIAFNRISNQSGLSVGWAPWDGMSVASSYAYMIDRSLGDSFGFLDSNSHLVGLSGMQRLGPYWAAGIGANYSNMTFRQQFQNSITMYGVGPMLSFQPTENLTMAGSVRYTIMEASQDGAIQDTSEFSGVSFNANISHRLTRNISHTASGGRMVQSGLGSNFTDSYMANYSVGWQVNRSLRMNAAFNWNQFKQSGLFGALMPIQVGDEIFLIPGSVSMSDSGTVYNIMVGSSYQFSEKFTGSLSYNYMDRQSSAFAGRDFVSHNIMLTLAYRF